MVHWQRCKGIIAKGARCRRMILRGLYGDYCHQHQWQEEPPGYSAGVAELGYEGDG